LSAMDGKIKQCVCIKFCVKLGKSTTKTHEMLRETWRTFFKLDSGIWMAFTFLGWSSVSWRWRAFRATKHQQNDNKCWKNQELIHEDRRWTIHEQQTPLGSVMEFARRS
jgi:hypothetical protein